jgi:uroporphyrinogen decarboxylase
MKLPLRNPEPDFLEFRNILLKKKKCDRVHIGELHIDTEIIKNIATEFLNRQWVDPGEKNIASQKKALQNYIDVWYKLGFDCIRLTSAFRFSAGISFPLRLRQAEGGRKWAEEGEGLIKNREDFEKYQWPCPQDINFWPFEFLADNLPEGMGILGCLSQGVMETVMFLVGYEKLCFLLYDDPELVESVFNRVGETIYQGYKRLVGMNRLLGFFQGDDMGFYSGLLFPPSVIKKYVLPWHKKFAELAHKNNLIYIFHSCGNIEGIMEEVITNTGIDAKHSFDDKAAPVIDFKKKYGARTGIIGGIDVDKLSRMEEKQLRSHVRNILDECLYPSGYILGSGNSITEYVPVENFLAMIDEGMKYKI